MKPHNDIKLSFLLYKGPHGYFIGRQFFGRPLQMTPSFETREQALAYREENDLNCFWDEILKFPKTYDAFAFDKTEGSITSELFKEDLGMKDVVIGNGYNNVSFASTASQTFTGFKELARFVGIPYNKIGLNGTLSLRAGTTQGKVSGTSAFIKDGNFIRVTTTKDKGATLARSWFDSVNFYLGVRTGKNDFLPTIMCSEHDENKLKNDLGTNLYSSYKNLVEYLYFTTICNIVERTQKCYPKGYCVYATPENILTRCLEEYVKSNTEIKDNILSTRKTESDFSATDPILRYESRPEFYRYPYPTASEKQEVLPLAKEVIDSIANFLN